MNKPTKPNITIPASFGGVKVDFDNDHLTNGFPQLTPDVLPGDCLNKLIDDTYKGLNFAIDCVDDLYKGIVLYSATETYDSTSLVFDISGTDIKLYHSLVDNNLGNPLTDTTKWEEVQLGGGTRNIGEIVTSTVPLTDAGLHLLDGSLISGSGVYADFVTYIADLYDSGDYTDIFETEANWQTAVTTYGVCGKFVYDSVNNTVRLPKITGILEGTTDTTALLDLVEAGLPNITGEVGWITGRPSAWGVKSGAFGNSTVGSAMGGSGSASSANDIDFDASLSNSIYGNSNTVQPQTIKVLYYIVVATSTKTDIQVDIDQIATDLNSKADVDLTNVNNSGTSTGASWAMPSATYTNLTLGASGSTYAAPANGWFQYIGTQSGATDFYLAANSGVSLYMTWNTAYKGGYVPVKKGDILTIIYGGTVSSVEQFRFYYSVGSESEA